MYFQWLQHRLLEALQRRLGNGLVTERGLARRAGISQPHLHHMVKGARALSPEMADRILRALQLTVFDLLEVAEEETAAGPRNGAGAHVGPARAPCPEPSREGLEESGAAFSAGGIFPLPGRSEAPGARPPPN